MGRGKNVPGHDHGKNSTGQGKGLKKERNDTTDKAKEKMLGATKKMLRDRAKIL